MRMQYRIGLEIAHTKVAGHKDTDVYKNCKRCKKQ